MERRRGNFYDFSLFFSSHYQLGSLTRSRVDGGYRKRKSADDGYVGAG
jgi:hypothetical protein